MEKEIEYKGTEIDFASPYFQPTSLNQFKKEAKREIDKMWEYNGCSECGGKDVDMDKVSDFLLRKIDEAMELQRTEIVEKVKAISPRYSGLPVLAGYSEEEIDSWVEGVESTIQEVIKIINQINQIK